MSATEQKTQSAATVYVMLQQSPNDPNVWVHKGTVEARSAEAAVRDLASAYSEQEASAGVALVAVPESSWKPRKATVKTERKVVLL